jgi:ion channel-forming bestrophin family protein
MIATKSLTASRLWMLVSVSKNRNLRAAATSARTYGLNLFAARVFSATAAPNAPVLSTGSAPPPDVPVTPLKPRFYVPKAERGSRNVFDIDQMVGETRLSRNSRTCPTRELNFLNVQWGRHKSPYRKFRHMANLFRAAPFQRLMFPDLFCVSTVAACLTYYNEFIATAATGDAMSMLSMSPSAFAGATTAIGLLAGFRLNACYGRYREGRQFWSETGTTLRDMSRQTMMWVQQDRTSQTRMLRLCQAFPIALMFHLNDKGCHHNMKRKSQKGEAPFKDRVQAEFQAELGDLYDLTIQGSNKDVADILNDDFERLCRIKAKGGNVPQEVLTCMAETISTISRPNNDTALIVNPMYIRELECQVQRLCKAMGSCERVLKTPLPTGFTRHSSRLLFIWSNSLPFALYPLLGPFGTLPTTILTSYAVLGIEDISLQLEEPFDILPLRQYSDGMIDSVKAIEEGYRPYPTSAGASD